jgi:cellulose synthase (UDP-forming)
VLGAAIAAAAERAQRRVNHRAEIKVPITLQMANGLLFLGRTVNISSAGAELVHRGLPALRVGDEVKIRFPHDEQETVFTGRIVAITPRYMSLAWEPMSRDAEAALVRCSIAQPGIWSDWTEGRRRDRPLHGLVEVLTAAGNGYRKLVRYALDLLVTSVAPALSLIGAVWRDFRTVLPYAPVTVNQAGVVTSALPQFNQEGSAVLLELPARPHPVYSRVEF